MNTFYEYHIDGIYGGVRFISQEPLKIVGNRLACTKALSYESDYELEDGVLMADARYFYSVKNNLTELSNEYGLPEGITMEMYFNMVMSRKDFNYGEIQSLKRQVSDFKSKQNEINESLSNDIWHARRKR